MTAPNVFIGIPAVTYMWTRSVGSVLRLIYELPGQSYVFLADGYSSCPTKRNTIVRRFLESKFDYLLMLDSDMIFPADLVQRLLAANKDVVGVLYAKRFPPFDSVGGRTGQGIVADSLVNYWPIAPKQGLQRVERVGGGVMLIRRAVLQAVGAPWFSAPAEIVDCDDFYFCQKALDAGCELWIDTDLEVGHMTIAEVTPQNAPEWCKVWNIP